MSDRDALACPQARQLIQAELDRPLRTAESASLRMHLAGCAGCRAYRTDLTEVQALLADAGRQLAHPPHNAPDLAPRVSRRVRSEQPRHMLFALAQATAQIGGLALVALLVVRGDRLIPAARPSVPTAEPVVAQVAGHFAWTPTPAEMRVPAFEFDDDRESDQAADPAISWAAGGPSQNPPGSLLPD